MTDEQFVDELDNRMRAALDALRCAGWHEHADQIVACQERVNAVRADPGENSLAGLHEALITIADNITVIADLLARTYPDPLHLRGERP
jgi:hypothetical protein